MKIGTRITLVTVFLVLATLGIYGGLNLRARRAELSADLERRMALVGAAIEVAFEAALQEGLFEDTGTLIRRWQEREPSITLAYIDLLHKRPGQPPPAFRVGPQGEHVPIAADGGAGDLASVFVPPSPDPTRAERLTRLETSGAPSGAHVTVDGRSVYALVVPVYDKEKRIVGAVELVADETETERAFAASVRTGLFAFGGIAVGLGLLVWAAARAAVGPLKRLVEAIDDVAAGDLGRVILGERDDEVGDLAERFNEMTGSLREARAEILAGVDAKLQLEARLRHSEKLATIGQLAAGIAHEVGTPLNVIGGRARSMEKRAPELSAADVAKNAAIIAEQTQRITKIIQQLLDYARRPATERTEVDLAAVAKNTLDFLDHQMAQHQIEAAVEPFVAGPDEGAPTAPLVIADPDQVQQVCMNLCVNAIQAMPDGGRLRVRTRGIVRRRPGLESAAPGRYVVIEVEDTGIGIPPEDRERIFEPFYSTKPPSPTGSDQGGTGLGLAVSVGIVKDHDGWIEIESPPKPAPATLVTNVAGRGPGTLFRVYLPAPDIR
jgi:signal transduction histidine kinase